LTAINVGGKDSRQHGDRPPTVLIADSVAKAIDSRRPAPDL